MRGLCVANQYGDSANGAFFKITPTFCESGGNSVTVLALLPVIVSSLLILRLFYQTLNNIFVATAYSSRAKIRFSLSTGKL